MKSKACVAQNHGLHLEIGELIDAVAADRALAPHMRPLMVFHGGVRTDQQGMGRFDSPLNYLLTI
jgi:hypothetical protein